MLKSTLNVTSSSVHALFSHASDTAENVWLRRRESVIESVHSEREETPHPPWQDLSKTPIAIFLLCISVAVTRKPMLTFI